MTGADGTAETFEVIARCAEYITAQTDQSGDVSMVHDRYNGYVEVPDSTDTCRLREIRITTDPGINLAHMVGVASGL